MKQIKVFTYTSTSNAGNWFTEEISNWLETAPEEHEYKIKDVHSNSNSHGWMIIITYKIKKKSIYPLS